MNPIKETVIQMAKSYGIELDNEAIEIIESQVLDKKEYRMLIEFIESRIFIANERA